ncbi:Lar family restriction alleviation protein [Candidatus Pacearchaeota archaeon]|nr:Lar family restriction alleviation protein [Candidatus Pacearchaeota archaeon]
MTIEDHSWTGLKNVCRDCGCLREHADEEQCLKPCPFCGCGGKLIEDYEEYAIGCENNLCIASADRQLQRVLEFGGSETAEQLLVMWNTRA